MSKDPVKRILEFAIKEEEGAVQFYTELSEKVKTPEMKNVFKEFATEERAHKKKLNAIRKGTISMKNNAKGEKVLDLDMSDYLVDVEASADMGYREALIVAMKKEKAAFMMYTDLGDRVQSPKMKAIFNNLAQEEARHKLRFEIEFEDNFETEKGW